MRILNIMLARGRGGIEQAALDYTHALRAAGHDVTMLVAPCSWARRQLPKNIARRRLQNFGAWDVFAAWRLSRLIKKTHAEMIITHGNRALCLALRAAQKTIPVVGLAHNYSTKHLIKADGAFAITQHLVDHLARQGMAREKIFHMPNMITVPNATPPARNEFRTPPVIGAMGRFVKKKGFDIWLRALAMLRDQGVEFRAVLGGSGEEDYHLRSLTRELKLESHVTFTGWVEDKSAFFDSIDIFCLPSLHEPFGIVLLEAFLAGVPIITGDSEGPREICTANVDARLYDRTDAAALAETLADALSTPARTLAMGKRGYTEVVGRYATPVIAGRMTKALEEVQKLSQKGHKTVVKSPEA